MILFYVYVPVNTELQHKVREENPACIQDNTRVIQSASTFPALCLSPAGHRQALQPASDSITDVVTECPESAFNKNNPPAQSPVIDIDETARRTDDTDRRADIRHLVQQNSTLIAVASSYKNALEEQKKRTDHLTNQLRGARSKATKIKASKDKLEQAVQSSSAGQPTVRSALQEGQGQRGHDPQYMAGLRYIKHACNLSNQRTSLALDLMH